MTTTLIGQCLCGGVRFEATGAFGPFMLCHCSRCRAGSGSSHAANLFAPGGALRWLRGGSAVQVFALAGTRHTRAFCQTCGSPMPSLQADGTLLVVPAGALRGDPSLPPAAHIHCASAAGWENDANEAVRYDDLPGSSG